MGYTQSGPRPASGSAPNEETPPDAFLVHRNTRSGGLIVASDFYATTGRTVGAFSDLVPQLTTGHSVWETLVPLSRSGAVTTADEYTRHWLADIRTSGLTVHAVFGFCVGSAFASDLVDRIAAWQGSRPRFIVFDPERPHAALLHRHYGDALKILATALSAEDMRAAVQAGEAAVRESAGLADLAARLADTLNAIGEPALDRIGLGVARRRELLGTFESFLSYLAVASQIDAEPAWRSATAISSTTPLNGLNVLSPQERDGIVEREIRFDLPHAELLRNADVAGTVDELMR